MAARKSSRADRRAQLRERFLERARHYLGVPYSRRYCTPGTPEYDAPLYLDCCTLVKRCVHDLQDEFGFRFKGYNQNYLFDTLPIERTAQTAEPGDIIFFEAQYHEKYREIQEKYCSKHDIVHVEIFVGGDSGEQSLGSRRLTGVATHDPYWLVDDRNDWYHSVKYHFRSLDTWLDGVCRSFCSLHSWDAPRHQAALPPIPTTTLSSSTPSSRPTGGDAAAAEKKRTKRSTSRGNPYARVPVRCATPLRRSGSAGAASKKPPLPDIGSPKGSCAEALVAVKSAISAASQAPVTTAALTQVPM